MDVITD